MPVAKLLYFEATLFGTQPKPQASSLIWK